MTTNRRLNLVKAVRVSQATGLKWMMIKNNLGILDQRLLRRMLARSVTLSTQATNIGLNQKLKDNPPLSKSTSVCEEIV